MVGHQTKGVNPEPKPLYDFSSRVDANPSSVKSLLQRFKAFIFVVGGYEQLRCGESFCGTCVWVAGVGFGVRPFDTELD